MSDDAIKPVDVDLQPEPEIEFVDNGAAALDAHQLVDLDTWKKEPDEADIALFVAPCHGPTLDVGCGPGRLAAALTGRKILAVGIDVSEEAVRLAQQRGAQAVHRDVFQTVPGEQHWQHVILADGNIGIGGDPVALLRRISDVMAPEGQIIAEVSDDGAGLTHRWHRLQIGDRVTAPFPWAVVGLDAVDKVAAEAGLRVEASHTCGGRHAATFVRV